MNEWLNQILSQLQIPEGKPQDALTPTGDTIIICKWCQEEKGVNPWALQSAGYKVSHMTCLRHLPNYVNIMYGKAEPLFSQIIQKLATNTLNQIKQRGWQGISRDLSRPENAPILQWLQQVGKGNAVYAGANIRSV